MENDRKKKIWPTSALVAVGLLGGVLIGALAVQAFSFASAEEDGGTPLPAATEPSPERWFIVYQGSPYRGEAFSTESDCDQERRKFVAYAEAEGQKAVSQLPPMSYRQIQALGYNPAERILATVEEARRAYCDRR